MSGARIRIQEETNIRVQLPYNRSVNRSLPGGEMKARAHLSLGLMTPLIAGALLCFYTVASEQARATPSTMIEKASPQLRHYILPLSFEENRGQADSTVKFLARSGGYSVVFRNREADFLLTKRVADGTRGVSGTLVAHSDPTIADVLRMRFLGANPSPAISGADRLPGIVNYFLGNDPSKWRTNVPTFHVVRYSDIYPGTELLYYGSGQQMEFDFRLAPGTDPCKVRIQFAGASKLAIDADGNLIIAARGGSVGFHKPIVYQPTPEGGRKPVQAAFLLAADDVVRFQVGRYDHSRPLIIDPILNYSTYFGSASSVTGVAVNSAGEAYVTGSAGTLPTTSGGFQTQNPDTAQSFVSAYVAKFNSTGTALIYCTYVDGSNYSDALAIALDSEGDAYITGGTNSADFPVTQGAFETTSNNPGGTGFVTELNSTGSALVYSTFLGGSALSTLTAITVDTNGNAYVTGSTSSTDFPTTAGSFQQTGLASGTGIVSKLNSTGSALVFSTYLGGSMGAAPAAIAVDGSGSAYVGGITESSDFPTTPGAYQTVFGGARVDGFLAKLNPIGTGLIYATYLGGSAVNAITEINAVALDSSENAYVTGNTDADNFPATAGAFQSAGIAGVICFVTKFNSSGSALVYSALLGSSVDAYVANQGAGIAVDPAGDAIVVGTTSGAPLPVTTGALETINLAFQYSGEEGSFVTKLNPAGSSLLYSTVFSGSGDTSGEECGDCADAVAIDPSDNVYVGGITSSIDFPTTLGAVETPFVSSDVKGFITEFNAGEMTTLPYPVLDLSSSANPQEWGKPVTFTATVQGTSGTTPTGTVAFTIDGPETSDALGTGYGPGPWNNVPLDGTGTATFTASNMTPVPHTVAAYYLGDGNYSPMTNSLTETITPIPTTTTLTASQNPAPYGTPVTFMATVLENNGTPATGWVDFGMNNIAYGIQIALNASGQASWTNGTGGSGSTLPVGTDTVFADFVPYGGYTTSSTTYSETFTPLGATPSPTFTPPPGTYTTEQSVSINDPNTASTIYYTTDGTPPTTNSIPYLGPILVFSSEMIEAIATLPGYSTSLVSSAAYDIEPTFSLAATTLTVSAGATSGNTSTITVTSNYGFTGSVILSPDVTNGPAGAVYPPSLSFGTTSPVNVASNGVGTATLTVTTTAPTASALVKPPQATRQWLGGGGALLACWLIFWIFPRRRNWRTLLGTILLLIPFGGLFACSGGSSGGGGGQTNPGTTPGVYTIAITGTSGALQETTTLELIVN
jgi:hypothetical protein